MFGKPVTYTTWSNVTVIRMESPCSPYVRSGPGWEVKATEPTTGAAAQAAVGNSVAKATTAATTIALHLRPVGKALTSANGEHTKRAEQTGTGDAGE